MHVDSGKYNRRQLAKKARTRIRHKSAIAKNRMVASRNHCRGDHPLSRGGLGRSAGAGDALARALAFAGARTRVPAVVGEGCSGATFLRAPRPETEEVTGTVRHTLFEYERERANGQKSLSSNRRSQDADEREAEVEREQNKEKEIDERERCGGAPQVESRLIEGTWQDPPLVFFSGNIPTDAGGVGDMSSWGLLVVRVGCAWDTVDIGLTASDFEQYRSPSGRRVLSQSNVDGQCSAHFRAFTIAGPTVTVLFRAELTRGDMDGVCNLPQRRVDAVTKSGILLGFDVRRAAEDGAAATVETWRWRGEKLVVGQKS